MPKKKAKVFRVLLVPEKGAPQEDEYGRKFVRVHVGSAESEAGAREYAAEQAMAEVAEHGGALYVVKSCEPV